MANGLDFMVDVLVNTNPAHDHRAISETLMMDAHNKFYFPGETATLNDFARKIAQNAGWIYVGQDGSGAFVFKRK